MNRTIILVNSIIAALLAAILLVYPAVRAVLDIRDPALKGPGVPQVDWRLMRHLTPRYAKWAKERVDLGIAKNLSTNNISGTEWPLFGSVFYLWAIENLQQAWEGGDHRGEAEPKVWCKDAIVAASELVIDRAHASWVEKHWGTNYLHHENVFYRMLVIASLTSRQKLLQDGAHTDMLRDQVETFAKELDSSKSGLLNDYPGECYPADVMAAIFAIRRADSVLGTDHSQFIRRSLRAFIGPRSTRIGLPPYLAGAETGASFWDARGCADSYLCITAPELWPEPAKIWFKNYEKFFWQERIGFAGFREFPKDVPKSDWTIDVDAGPVIDGFGVAANAFGVGATRKNGRFDLAYPLATEMLATVWEMPNGTLAMPRALSNLSDAPMLGEAAILWLLSVQPEKGFPIKSGGSVPSFVYVMIVCALLLGLWAIAAAYDRGRSVLHEPESVMSARWLQLVIWMSLIAGAVASFYFGYTLVAVALCLAALLFPRTAEPPPSEWGSPEVVPGNKTGTAPD
jgi:hypothetical protein